MALDWNKDFVAEFERFIDFEEWADGRYDRKELKRIWEDVTGLVSEVVAPEKVQEIIEEVKPTEDVTEPNETKDTAITE